MSPYDTQHPGTIRSLIARRESQAGVLKKKTRVVLIAQYTACNHVTQRSLSQSIIINYNRQKSLRLYLRTRKNINVISSCAAFTSL